MRRPVARQHGAGAAFAIAMLVPCTGLQRNSSHDIDAGDPRSPSKELAGGNIIVYHKTGVKLTNQALLKCMPDANITHSEYGLAHAGIKNITRPTVMFLRDGFNIARSAYFYHREAAEGWLRHKPMVSPYNFVAGAAKVAVPVGSLHVAHKWVTDKVVGRYVKVGESYQDFLNRVPMEVGVRAEYLRSLHEVKDILADRETCLPSSMCLEVCMETLTASSELYNQTWSSVLTFLGYSPDEYMDCLASLDLNAGGAVGHGMTRHATSLHIDEADEATVRKMLWRIDYDASWGVMARQRRVLGCRWVRGNRSRDDDVMDE